MYHEDYENPTKESSQTPQASSEMEASSTEEVSLEASPSMDPTLEASRFSEDPTLEAFPQTMDVQLEDEEDYLESPPDLYETILPKLDSRFEGKKVALILTFKG